MKSIRSSRKSTKKNLRKYFKNKLMFHSIYLGKQKVKTKIENTGKSLRRLEELINLKKKKE